MPKTPSEQKQYENDIAQLIAFYRSAGKEEIGAGSGVRLRTQGLIKDVKTDVSKEIAEIMAKNHSLKIELVKLAKNVCVKHPKTDRYGSPFEKVLGKFQSIPESCVKLSVTQKGLDLMKILGVEQSNAKYCK